jgi:hypothetical protein
MDQPTRNDSYRQLRVLIDPAPGAGRSYLSVVARSSRRGVHRDSVVFRRALDVDLGQVPLQDALKVVSAALADAADTLHYPTG